MAAKFLITYAAILAAANARIISAPTAVSLTSPSYSLTSPSYALTSSQIIRYPTPSTVAVNAAPLGLASPGLFDATPLSLTTTRFGSPTTLTSNGLIATPSLIGGAQGLFDARTLLGTPALGSSGLINAPGFLGSRSLYSAPGLTGVPAVYGYGASAFINSYPYST